MKITQLDAIKFLQELAMKILDIVKRANVLEEEFPTGSRWRHVNGREYEVLGVANIANNNPKYEPVIVYKSVVPTPNAIIPSRLWTKTPDQFRNRMTKTS